MKTHLTIICAFFVVIMMASCKKDAVDDKFEQSYNAWLKFKAESQNSYNYSVRTSSLSGFNTETILYVQNGRVVKRSFKATTEHAGPPVVVQEEWIEEEGNLNTHQKGAPAKTLDEIYAEVKSKWLIKHVKAVTYFETNNDGMISLAGYEENGCMDDCFKGISIGFIVKILYN